MAYTTTAICGYGGVVTLVGGASYEVTEWNADVTMESHDVSFLQGSGGDHARRYIGCLKGMTGDFTSLSNCGISAPTPDTLAAPYDFKSALSLKTKNSAGTTYACNCGITSYTCSTDAKGIATWKFSFVASGAVTIT